MYHMKVKKNLLVSSSLSSPVAQTIQTTKQKITAIFITPEGCFLEDNVLKQRLIRFLGAVKETKD